MAYFKKPKLIWSIAIAATATVISAICLTNAAQSKVASVNLDNFNMYKVGAPGDKDRGTVIAVNDKDFTLPHGTCPIFVNGSVITDVGAVVDDKAVYIPIEKVAYALGKKYISQYKKSELSTSKVIDGKTYLAENDLEKLFKVNVDYYNKDGDNNVNPYFAPFSHVIISGGIKKEKLTAQRATEELRSALITAFENVYGEYTPLYEKPNSVYNEMQNMRYIITTLKPKAETDRFYQFPVVYDFWVDKYTGEVYAYYNGISNWVYLFNPHDKNALSFPG